MNETGLKVVLDGINSYFVEKATGKSTPIQYEHGRYYVDIWAPAAIKSSIADKKNNNDMEVDGIIKYKPINNRCWVLGTDEESEGF